MGWRKRSRGIQGSLDSLTANPEVHEFGKQLCAAIGQGTTIFCSSNHLFIDLPGCGEGGGMNIDIDRTHWKVYGEWVFDDANNYCAPANETLTMKVRKDRGIAGLAEDIKRKFLPKYPERLQAMKDNADSADAARAKSLASYQALCKVAGEPFSEAYYSERIIHGSRDSHIYTMLVNSDGGLQRTIVDGIPPEGAAEFITMMKEFFKKYGKE